MPLISELRDDIEKYIKKHGLSKKWEKAKKLFENDLSHPSLNTEILEPKHRLIYSFRIDRKYCHHRSKNQPKSPIKNQPQ